MAYGTDRRAIPYGTGGKDAVAMAPRAGATGCWPPRRHGQGKAVAVRVGETWGYGRGGRGSFLEARVRVGVRLAQGAFFARRLTRLTYVDGTG